MSESEFLKRVIAEIEALSADWMENGPSKATARAIINKIRAMPAALQKQDKPQ